MRTKLLTLKSLLVMCLLAVVSGAQAQTVLAQFTNGDLQTKEWTTNANSSGTNLNLRYNLLAPTDYVQSPILDLSSVNSIDIEINARTYGGVDAAKNTITILFVSSQDNSESTLGTITPKNSDKKTYSAKGLNTADLTQGYIKFVALSAGSNKGAAIYTAKITDPSSTTPETIYDDLASLKKVATTGNSYKVKFTNAIVTKVNGNNCYIEDAKAGILLYLKNHGFEEGDKLNGTATVDYNVYEGTNQITSLTGVTKEAGATIPCTKVSISELLNNLAAYESMRVKVEMATTTQEFSAGRDGSIKEDDKEIAIFKGHSSTQFDCLRKGAYVDVIGYPYNFVKDGIETPTIKVWSGDINSDNYKEALSISEAQYATAYYADAFFMPAGITGAIVTKNGDGIQLVEKYNEGDLVPAKTALILKGAKMDYDLFLGDTEELAPAGNLLHGTTQAEMTNAGKGNFKYYKLSYDNNNENLGFYWSAEGGAAFMNGANKAYLALPQTEALSMMKGFSLNDLANGTVTRIDAVNANANKVTTIYDLNGRRMNSLNGAAKGLYIVNGKKILVK